MAIEVTAQQHRVAGLRKALDPLAPLPPTIGTNEAIPGLTVLVYPDIKELEDANRFAATAMGHGAQSCTKM